MRRGLSLAMVVLLFWTGVVGAQTTDRIARFIRIRDNMYSIANDAYSNGLQLVSGLEFEYLGIALTSYEWGLESREEFIARVSLAFPGWRSDPGRFGPSLGPVLEVLAEEPINYKLADAMLEMCYNRFKLPSSPEWGYWR